MRLRSLVGRLDEFAGRVNRWFGPAAVAASAARPGEGGKIEQVDTTAVVAALGEVDQHPRPTAEHRREPD